MLRAGAPRATIALGLGLFGLTATPAVSVPLNLLLGDADNPPAQVLVSDDGSVTFANFDFVPTRLGPEPEDIDVSSSPDYPGGFIVSAPLETFRGRPSIILLAYDALAEDDRSFLFAESELIGPVFDSSLRSGPPDEPFMASAGVYDQFLTADLDEILRTELFVFTHRRWNHLDDCGNCGVGGAEEARLFDSTDLSTLDVSAMRVFAAAGVQVVPGVLGGDIYPLQFAQNFVVPDPATWTVGLIGFGLLIARRRREA